VKTSGSFLFWPLVLVDDDAAAVILELTLTVVVSRLSRDEAASRCCVP